MRICSGVLGTTHGSGDGSTTFNLPDFRGDLFAVISSGTSKEVGKRQGEGLPEITGGLLQIPGGLMPLTAGAFLPTVRSRLNLCQRQYGKCRDRLYDRKRQRRLRFTAVHRM